MTCLLWHWVVTGVILLAVVVSVRGVRACVKCYSIWYITFPISATSLMCYVSLDTCLTGFQTNQTGFDCVVEILHYVTMDTTCKHGLTLSIIFTCNCNRMGPSSCKLNSAEFVYHERYVP